MFKVLEINNRCISCDSCRFICPEHSVITNGKDYHIDPWSCTQCELCIQVCPTDAIIHEENPLNKLIE